MRLNVHSQRFNTNAHGSRQLFLEAIFSSEFLFRTFTEDCLAPWSNHVYLQRRIQTRGGWEQALFHRCFRMPMSPDVALRRDPVEQRKELP
jgi:hypothetical protein